MEVPMIPPRLRPCLVLLAAATLAACATPAAAPTPTSPADSPPLDGAATPGADSPFAGQTLRVMTHDSFAVTEDLLRAFEASTGAKVQILESGDTGSALNKAILAREAPLADVFYGVDNTFLSRALEEGIFEPYDAPALAEIPPEFQLDPEKRALPVDHADICLNYDKRWFTDKGLDPPGSLADLVDPQYKGQLALPNPALSSPGLGFLLTTIAEYGEAGYLDYWRELMANDALVVNDWETAYNTEFSGGPGQGSRPIVVSYASSPAFEVLYGSGVTEPNTAAVVADGTCFRQVETVGILLGTKARPLAEKFVDFMLSPPFQADMPSQMFVFPVRPGVQLDPVFTRFLSEPTKLAEISAEAIAAGREQWLKDWTEAVLR
jgi:thiamine transport system substrate-binding protein